MKMLRTVLGYAALAVGVTVGGVVIGAMVVAPAVSRSKPLLERAFSNNVQGLEETGGAVGQADGDPRNAGPIALAAGRVPKLFWVFANIGAVVLMAGAWFWRRRRAATPNSANPLSDNRLAASLPSKLVPGKGNRTPRAVATLAEAGNSPADIARRTGLALDAVAMLISMGSLGARQLQPPTA